MRKLIHEIHRRSLWQVLGIYLAVSWIVLQVVDVVGNNFGLPAWVAPAALVLLLLGLPVVLATAFVQEGIGSPPPSVPADPTPGTDAEAGSTEPAPGASRPATSGENRRVLTWRKALLGGVGAFALLGLVTAAYLFMRASGIGPAGTLVAKGILDEQERLVLADFESTTDTVLARTVTETLRRALAESSVLRFVEHAQLSEILRRMDRDPESTAIDRETSREIAIREGLKGFVGGVVDRVGSGYVLSADLVVAESGETALSHQESAPDDTGLIDAIDRLSRRFRERAGESLRAVNASPRLAGVTTSSLAALQNYVQGRLAYDRRGEGDAAIGFYEEAVAIDTAFAMAYRALAVIYANQGRGRSLVVDAMEHAIRHQDRLGELERAYLQAFYHQTVTLDREAATAAYRRSLDFDPDSTALNNLGVVYQQLRRFDDAEWAFGRAVARGSRIWQTHSGLMRMSYALGKRDETRAILARAKEVVPDSARWAWWEMALDAAEGDYDGADSALDAYEAAYGREPGGAVLGPAWRADLAGLRGRLEEAEAELRLRMDRLLARGGRAGYLTTATDVAALRLEAADSAGGLEVLEEALRRQPVDSISPLDRPYFPLALTYASLGFPARARDLIGRWETEVDPAVDDPLGIVPLATGGALALAEGRPEEAVTLFLEADERAGGCPICRLPEIGLAYDRAGLTDSAVAVYERFLDTPWHARLSEDGSARGRILERLGQLYDELGDRENAVKYYAMFVELWAEADDVLQPRVQAAQERLEAILREIG